MMTILDCLEYGAGSCRNEDMIKDLIARAEAAEAEVERLRYASRRDREELEAEMYRLANNETVAEAEVERLRKQVATLRADVALMLRTPHNHDWLPTDGCPRCAIEQRLVANASQDAR